MKNTYIAVTVKDENDKYYAYIVKCNATNNLLNKLNIKGILHANICDTKRAAVDLICTWNNQYKSNGTYMFQNSPFD